MAVNRFLPPTLLYGLKLYQAILEQGKEINKRTLTKITFCKGRMGGFMPCDNCVLDEGRSWQIPDCCVVARIIHPHNHYVTDAEAYRLICEAIIEIEEKYKEFL